MPQGNACGRREEKAGAARLWRQVVRCRHLYLLILPAVAAVFIFHYIPIYGIFIAFKDYRTSRGIMGSEWVGLKHFINFIQYPYFKRIMWNTLWISLVSLMTFPASIIFAANSSVPSLEISPSFTCFKPFPTMNTAKASR